MVGYGMPPRPAARHRRRRPGRVRVFVKFINTRKTDTIWSIHIWRSIDIICARSYSQT